MEPQSFTRKGRPASHTSGVSFLLPRRHLSLGLIHLFLRSIHTLLLHSLSLTLFLLIYLLPTDFTILGIHGNNHTQHAGKNKKGWVRAKQYINENEPNSSKSALGRASRKEPTEKPMVRES